MTREIKFRAWDKDENKMRTGEFGLSKSVVCRLDTKPNPNGTWRTELGKCFNGILMQFTGLKDKNGKEIYEGDIVKDNDGENLVVKWQGEKMFSNPCFCPVSANDESGSRGGYNSWALIEVIGNIYENPELLKTN